MAKKAVTPNEYNQFDRSEPMSEAKRAVLDKALGDIIKRYGDGAIMRLGEAHNLAVEVIPTGSLSLDIALGVGGIPRGRITEIFGPESSGKTTLCLHIAAEAQKLGGTVAFIDMEHALDPAYAAKLGVDVESLLVSQPDMGEQALEIAETLVRSGAVDLVIIDSVAALVPRAEIEGEMGDSHMGLQARLMSQAMRKLTGAAYRSGTAILFINQTRQKIGVTYGSNLTTTGGTALKFYASVRLDIHRIGAVKEGEAVVGNRTKVKVVKNKLAPPFKEAEFDIIYGRGVYREAEIIDLGLAHDLVKKSGSWFAVADTQLGQGRSAAAQWLAAHPEQRDRLVAAILERVKASAPSTARTEADAEEEAGARKPAAKAA